MGQVLEGLPSRAGAGSERTIEAMTTREQSLQTAGSRRADITIERKRGRGSQTLASRAGLRRCCCRQKALLEFRGGVLISRREVGKSKAEPQC